MSKPGRTVFVFGIYLAILGVSVAARMTVIVFFGAFVLAGFVSPMLLLFGAVDFAGALWTYSALRQAAGAPALA